MYQKSYSDRLIPRREGNNWETIVKYFPDKENTSQSLKSSNEKLKVYSRCYDSLLKNEILNESFDNVNEENKGTKLFSYRPTEKKQETFPSVYSLNSFSHKLLFNLSQRSLRQISLVPYKELTGTGLQDNYYTNLMDWSSQNLLGVALEYTVYLWSPVNSKVTILCDLSFKTEIITALSYSPDGRLLAIGTNDGLIELWDVITGKRLIRFIDHISRVGVLTWKGTSLFSGSRDYSISQRDTRSLSCSPVHRLKAHTGEVCGLQWSPDSTQLASGGNDNLIYIWNDFSSTPEQVYTAHKAAVKALAWSPHCRNLLASGGGLYDNTLRFWNTRWGKSVSVVDTGSQICNIVWSKISNEFVTTHGFSDNKIVVWKYPSLTTLASIKGQSHRILQVALSSDSETIVTGSANEYLNFWRVFQKTNRKETKISSSLERLKRIR